MFFYYVHTMINIVSIFSTQQFQRKKCHAMVKIFISTPRSKVQSFLDFFYQQMKWWNKYIEHSNILKKFVAFRVQFPQGKEYIVGPKQVALENHVNFPWSKMKFLGSEKVPQGTNEVPCKTTFMKNKKGFPRKRAISLGINEFSLGKGPSSPQTRAIFSRSNELYLGKGPSSLKKHMFWIFL